MSDKPPTFNPFLTRTIPQPRTTHTYLSRHYQPNTLPRYIRYQMPSLNPFSVGKKPKDRNSGGFLSRLVGGLKENEPYVPFRERYTDNTATPNTAETKEAGLEEQQTVRNNRPPIPETFRSDITQQDPAMRQPQIPRSQTTPNRAMPRSVTFHRNPMTRNSIVIDTGAVIDGKMRFRSASMIKNSSTFHSDYSPRTQEIVNQNITPIRRLVRQNNNSPTDGGLESRPQKVQQSSPIGHSGIYENPETSISSRAGPSRRPYTLPGANELHSVGVTPDENVHSRIRDDGIGTGYPDMSFKEDERVISHTATRDKGKGREIDDTENLIRSRSIHEARFPISYPEASNHSTRPSRKSKLPSPDEYLSIPNNPFLPLPTTPESVTSLPRIYPDKDGIFRVSPAASYSSGNSSRQLHNSATMSAPYAPVVPSAAFNGMQNSNTMPSSPGSEFTSSRPVMSSSPSGGLRDTPFSASTMKGIQSASSSNYDMSVIDGSSVYSDDVPVVTQASAPATHLNKRVMQLSATTPEKQTTPPPEVRKMKNSATATSDLYSAPKQTGCVPVAQVQQSPRQLVQNVQHLEHPLLATPRQTDLIQELQLQVMPRHLASGPSRERNILHNDPIQARRYEGGRRKPRAAGSNHQEPPLMLEHKLEQHPAISQQQQSQYARFVKIEDIHEMDREQYQAQKQRQWEEKQQKRTGLSNKGASKFGTGGFRKSISTLFKGPKTPKVAQSMGNLGQEPPARDSNDHQHHQPNHPEAQNHGSVTFRQHEVQNQWSATFREPEVPAMYDKQKMLHNNHRDAGGREVQDQHGKMNAGPSNAAGSSHLSEIPTLLQQSPPQVPLQASPARVAVLHPPPDIVQEPSSGKICQSSQSIPKPWEPAVNPQRASLTARVEAEICLDNEDIDTAIEWYESIKDDAVHTNQPHVFFNLGQLNMLKSDHDAAEDYFRQAVEFDDYLLPGYMQLAYLAYWDEDFDLADSYWEKALHCLVGGRQEVDYETVGLAYTCSYIDIWWNRSAAQTHEHGMDPSKVPYGAIFRVPGFQANSLDCVLGTDTVRERRPWEFGGEGRVIYSADPEEKKSEKNPKPQKFGTWKGKRAKLFSSLIGGTVVMSYQYHYRCSRHLAVI
ncbi:hypothetical protein BZA77DRAFT_297752 [Pyronema omphalodes]|nr:hypothetical protein BZA77DRAFT_297752 [Pyronema omphalodes]